MAKKPALLQELNIVMPEMAAANSIKPNPYNPNRQSDDEFLLLIRSIIDDGFTDPVLVNRDSREIIDGEHRWTAAIVLHHLKKAGLPVSLATTSEMRKKRAEILDPALMIPINLLDKDEIQRRISTQRHNKARGHDDVELAAQMFRELEALGGLEAAMAGLDMTNEEADRLLAYGDSILDHFPGDTPSMAWEPRNTLPGQVESWVDPANNQAQSVSKAAATPTKGAQAPTDTPAVPGLQMDNLNGPNGRKVEGAPPPMARRIYVFLEEEARIVDKALGKDAATVLVQMCKERLSHEHA